MGGSKYQILKEINYFYKITRNIKNEKKNG